MTHFLVHCLGFKEKENYFTIFFSNWHTHTFPLHVESSNDIQQSPKNMRFHVMNTLKSYIGSHKEFKKNVTWFERQTSPKITILKLKQTFLKQNYTYSYM